MSEHPWSQWVIRGAFALTGLIHLLPLAGVLGRATLERAYGIHLGEGQDLVILMQHRAVLFGLLAAACLLAAVMPNWRVPVGIAALGSILAFVLIAVWQPHGEAIATVMWVDAVASLVLAVGLLLHVKPDLVS